jgi:hypothetical protein
MSSDRLDYPGSEQYGASFELVVLKIGAWVKWYVVYNTYPQEAQFPLIRMTVNSAR